MAKRIVVTNVLLSLVDVVGDPDTGPAFTWEAAHPGVAIEPNEDGTQAVLSVPDTGMRTALTVKDSGGNVVATSDVEYDSASGSFSITPSVAAPPAAARRR